MAKLQAHRQHGPRAIQSPAAAQHVRYDLPQRLLLQGITIQIERKGFWVLDLKQEV